MRRAALASVLRARAALAGAAAVGWLLAPAPSARADGWPMEGHDVRRTGQSRVLGPALPERTTTFVLPAEQAINVPPTVGDLGMVYVGTWGVTRSYGLADRTRWHKSDGKLFAWHPDFAPAWPAPFPGELVPYCYAYPGRPATPAFCPGGGTVNGYNGTVEGTPALSPDASVLYVGRGDGKLYALDAWTGALRWRFRTFNPEDPADPEGGGEVVAAPLVAPDGTIFLATAGAGAWESNAVYALAPDGRLLWRFPAAEKSWQNGFLASPALSPDGRTLYVAGAWGPTIDHWDVTVPGSILAFDLAAPSGSGDDRLKWVHHPINEGEWWRPTVWTTALAVGADGALYASGPEYTLGGHSAVLFALRDAGDHAEPAWTRMVDLDRDRANFTLGIALREVAGVTTRVYATSGTPFLTLSQSYGAGGKLHAFDAATGAPLWPAPFDPEAHGGFGALTGVALDAAGVIYTGVSGQRDGGKVFAVGEDGGLLWEYTVGGLLQWGHPVLGPEGNLYFADTRTCLGADVFPLESGVCAGRVIDPALYVIHGSGGGPCVPGERAMCLLGGRFRVEVEWRTPQGGAGRGRVVPVGAGGSGLFWFFNPDNWEMLVKMVDGCALNGHVWTFFAATTNVAFRLRVTDTQTGASRTYANPQGQPAHAVTDTRSLAACGP